MKRTLFLFAILIALALTACSGGSPSAAVQDSSLPAPAVVTRNDDSSPVQNGSLPQATPLAPEANGSGQINQLQLLVGILGLEGTDQALTPTQATSILPSLTVLQESTGTGEPNTDSQKQDEMIAFIQSILTNEQIEAIQAMDLTQAGMTTLLTPYGISLDAFQGQRGNGGGDPLATPQGGQFDPQPLGTPSADRPQGGGFQGGGQRGGFGGLPTGLLDALMTLLQTRAAS